MIEVKNISGIQDFTTRVEQKDDKNRTLYLNGEKVFLVENPHTLEIRCDAKLSKLLQAEYESVMESRYFGRGGIEIVPSPQLNREELEDLIRLSYNLSS